MNSSSAPEKGYDYTFKIVLIGDSGVGKSSIILNYTSDNKGDHLPSPTVGAYTPSSLTLFLKSMRPRFLHWLGRKGSGHSLVLSTEELMEYLWGPIIVYMVLGLYLLHNTLTSIHLLVYDVTRKDTFTSLANKWIEELKLYSAYHDSVKVLVGNKLDLECLKRV
ncbi:hypothetical protein ZIOFF_018276 [Zingiber officinale]|uniref:Uncharacterized protein n=1 Tax=Zingiber officinale TaxID=94328 RepID=A0A8J5H5W1_ZINOF|nr:hypothetical protein ZIOFF_018276 [Zingiber officinale]